MESSNDCVVPLTSKFLNGILRRLGWAVVRAWGDLGSRPDPTKIRPAMLMDFEFLLRLTDHESITDVFHFSKTIYVNTMRHSFFPATALCPRVHFQTHDIFDKSVHQKSKSKNKFYLPSNSNLE